VRLYFLPIEYVAQRALSQFGKAAVPLRRALLPRMAGEHSVGCGRRGARFYTAVEPPAAAWFAAVPRLLITKWSKQHETNSLRRRLDRRIPDLDI
jgi:hypothetical protein